MIITAHCAGPGRCPTGVLDHCLRPPDLAYNQPRAMGALAYTDSVVHSDWLNLGRFLQPLCALVG
ncbi:hypothetical protein WN71_008810 [Streptomyces mangrovisoli]|uniref:Uncharacterized protein n=1 Tax=Streptomyces mangrovisoli TaxID=1428628 RepID=A0A1J4P0L3_9ACTN|nr:hypothetical protein WN71_008810 [Streptomyces mangrovisoli]